MIVSYCQEKGRVEVWSPGNATYHCWVAFLSRNTHLIQSSAAHRCRIKSRGTRQLFSKNRKAFQRSRISRKATHFLAEDYGWGNCPKLRSVRLVHALPCAGSGIDVLESADTHPMHSAHSDYPIGRVRPMHCSSVGRRMDYRNIIAMPNL